MDAKLTAERLRVVLSYDAQTGQFVWLKSANNRVLVGTLAGKRKNNHGYHEVQIDGRLYKAHRLAWLYVYGIWPDGEIDHINGDRADNRIVNLRDVSLLHNSHNRKGPSRNNKTGFLGVVKKPNGRFQAGIRVANKHIHLGYFATPEEAHAAYLAAKREMHAGSVFKGDKNV